jgi:hypothetical protein
LFLVLSLSYYQINLNDNTSFNTSGQTQFKDNIDTNIHLKFWGYNDQASENIINSLEIQNTFLQQTYVRENDNEKKNFVKSIDGRLWTWENNIHIEKIFVSPNLSNILYNTIQLGVNPLNFQSIFTVDDNSTIIEGSKININTVINALLSHNPTGFVPEPDFTVHILNLTFLDDYVVDSGNHWFFGSASNNFYKSSADFRNFGIIDYRNFFYDPTGINPFFNEIGNPLFTINSLMSSEEKIQYLDSQISQIIEQAIVGSPYNRPYTLLDFSRPLHHFSKVTIYNSTNVVLTQNIIEKYQPNLISAGISGLFSFYPNTQFEISQHFLDINQFPFLESIIIENTQIIDDKKVLIITDEIANQFKNGIRNPNNNIYSSYPQGFYFLTMTIAIDTDLRIKYKESENILRSYNTDIIGLSITNINSWLQLNSNERGSVDIYKMQLRAVGQNLGLVRYSGSIGSQIPSVMSDYFIESNLGLLFNEIDMYSIIKKYVLIIDTTIRSKLSSYRDAIVGSYYRYIPHSILDYPEGIRMNASIEFQNKNYGDSIKLYLESIRITNEVINTMNQRINGVYNTFILVLILVLLYVINVFFIVNSKEKRGEALPNKLPKNWYKNKL